MSAPTNSWR